MLVVGGRSQRTYGVARAGGIPISLAVLVGPDGQAQAEGHEHDRRATRHVEVCEGRRSTRNKKAPFVSGFWSRRCARPPLCRRLVKPPL